LNFAEGCEDCRRLSAAYEAATMEWFRVQGQFRVAEYLHEQATSHQIVAQLNVIARRRQLLREETEQHVLMAHPKVSTAST
jgi:hypothetical protein